VRFLVGASPKLAGEHTRHAKRSLTMSTPSVAWTSIAPFDIVPIPQPGDHLNPVLCYLGPEGAKKYLTHP
jgi:hypothetical protein